MKIIIEGEFRPSDVYQSHSAIRALDKDPPIAGLSRRRSHDFAAKTADGRNRSHSPAHENQ